MEPLTCLCNYLKHLGIHQPGKRAAYCKYHMGIKCELVKGRKNKPFFTFLMACIFFLSEYELFLTTFCFEILITSQGNIQISKRP